MYTPAAIESTSTPEFTYERLFESFLSGDAELTGGARAFVHMTESLPPISRLDQFRNALKAGFEVVRETDGKTVRIVHEGWEFVFLSKRAWRAAGRALREVGR